jgi:DNA-directed RNA polymerase III subunit RPC8
VAPSQFSAPAHIAITNELNKKYANRVLLDIGLCICVFDLIWVGEGVVKYGDGCYWYKGEKYSSAKFRFDQTCVSGDP